MLTIVYPTCLQNVKPIWRIIHDLHPKQIFQQIMNLTLTFDPMTLTLPNLSTKFETDPTHHSWSTAKTIFSENRVFDLDLWPYDLDLIPNCSPYWCLPSHLFWFQSDQWYMRYWQKRSFVTNGPTNQRTNQPTDQPTKLFIEMRRSCWTHLKKNINTHGSIYTTNHSFTYKQTLM